MHLTTKENISQIAFSGIALTLHQIHASVKTHFNFNQRCIFPVECLFVGLGKLLSKFNVAMNYFCSSFLAGGNMQSPAYYMS